MMTESLEGFRLSPQQRRLWSLQQQDGAAAYRTACAVSIEAGADPARLRGALEEIVRHHEILRTTFRFLPGMSTPLQVVNEHLPIFFEERVAAGAGEASLWSHDGMNLAEGPILFAALWRPPGNSAKLFLELPALCADRPTLERVVLELSALLGGPSDGEQSLGNPLQYPDVAEWLNDLPEKAESAPGIEYWRKRSLAGADSALSFEKPEGSEHRFDPRSFSLSVSEQTSELLEQRCHEIGCTPRALLLTCWQTLLGRLIGDGRPVLAYATEGRRHEELKHVLGPCARYVPLNGELQDESPFRVAVSRIESTIKDQENWEELFQWDRADVPGRRGTIPFFSFGFDYASRLPIGSSSLRLEEVRARIDRFKVHLACARTERGLRAELDYDASRIEREDVERLAARLTRTIESALLHPETSVGELDILPDDEKRRLYFEFNDTRREFSDNRPIPERLAEVAARAPEDVAVVCEGRRLTYRELDERANRIAHTLKMDGVESDSLVGLCVERSVEMIVGLLAIWKSGGAYVPLDPSLPVERLAFLLEDTGASLVLTRSTLADRFAGSAARVIFLDAGSDAPGTNPECRVRPESLAYVIFTSGSTGQPKGVAVEHRQLSNYVNAILEVLQPPPAASFATVTTLAADLGNTAIFPSLVTGGRLHVVAEQRASDSVALAEDFSRDPIDYLKIVPSHLAALLSSTRPERILPVQCLVLGGEASSWELIEQVRRLAPSCRILNHYGPTEATIGVTTFPIPAASRGPAARTVPVGKPLGNCRILLLDSHARPVPLGVVGELHIGGASLARGYLNRPELTAERFVELDLEGRRERFYKTGDLARYLPDGNIELLGRTDDQIKLHGFRIEPGEVEAALRQHPQVREAVVLSREVAGAGKRLVAYIVPRAGEPPAPADLRRLLLGKLPEFMLPSAFVRLGKLPLTPNGKIDRAALPLPDPTRPDESEPLVPPRTPEEKILAKVWKEVLRIERFGVHDNFFELGGDSILAIQIIARASRQGLRLTPRQLFERQTIAELAEVGESSVRVDAAPGPVTGPVPLTPIQHWFFEQDLADPHHYNQSVLLESREPFDLAALEGALALLMTHHDALRLRFTRDLGGWRQSNAASESGPVFSGISLDRLTDGQQNSAIEKAVANAQATLNLSEGPIARALAFDLGPKTAGRLLLIVHHLAVDSVSWRILLEDLENAYLQIRNGRDPVLPPRTTSFKEWAEKLTELAKSDALEREASYWLSRTSDSLAPLPTDLQGENTVESARSVESLFSEEETRALLQEVPAVYRTQINDALLTALTEAFNRWTDSRTLLLDLEGHGREEVVPGIDLSRTVGWFTTRFPVLLQLPESADSGESLMAVKEQLRAIPQRGIGYGILRYLGEGGGASNRWRSLPEPAVSFNYLGQFDQLLPEDSIFRVLPSVGPTRSARDHRPHLISVEGKVMGGRLRFAWIYSENLHRRATVERLAQGFEQALRSLLAHCRSAEAGTYTPSDFPKARLSKKDLEILVAGLKTTDPGLRR